VFGEEVEVVGELTMMPTTAKTAESRVMRESRKTKSHGRAGEISALARALLSFYLTCNRARPNSYEAKYRTTDGHF
jgi:hypothetical protein